MKILSLSNRTLGWQLILQKSLINNGKKFSTTSTNLVQIYQNAAEAIEDVKSNSTILCGGFGLCGIPENLIKALSDKQGAVKDLTVVSNNAGVNDFGVE